ncbi:protein ABC1 homolog, mitochondrial-like [Mizuhopecten yessoensis]|uniref:Chaperone activity of bc1 complex-like, mitochondrial n=1 Tax=Mizuhopecten yessoensis TaxID=6573 RepID=A0A210QMY1_MIZYE|nr:protein ABC1 homolog, mitochondrial-like [Mizuhopecten yessoensis]OWF50083.1 Chaperone activity of bc1 complex-like, mitochondrial [Mizuhopecten yessoensis]
MSRDFVGFLRGVEKIGQAMSATQRSKWQHVWHNSSVKFAAGQVVSKVEDQVSGAITRPDEFQNSVQDKMGLMASQLSILVKTVRSQSQIPRSEQPYPFELDPEVPPENVETTGVEEATVSQLEEEMASLGMKLGDTTVNVQSAATETVDPSSSTVHKILEDTVDTTSRPVHKIVEDIIASKTDKNSIVDSKIENMTSNSSADFETTSTEQVVSPPPTESVVTKTIPVQKTSQTAAPRKPIVKAPEQKLRSSARERKVPANMVSRLSSYGGLAVGLLAGTIGEVSKRKLGLSKPAGSLSTASIFINEANAERVVNTLCRARGAALKLGQMISVQDTAVVPPEIQKIFDRVRQGADIMPTSQMLKTVTKNLSPGWQDLVDLEEKPFASASIGQVHRGVMKDGRKVAMKVQVAIGVKSSGI